VTEHATNPLSESNVTATDAMTGEVDVSQGDDHGGTSVGPNAQSDEVEQHGQGGSPSDVATTTNETTHDDGGNTPAASAVAASREPLAADKSVSPEGGDEGGDDGGDEGGAAVEDGGDGGPVDHGSDGAAVGDADDATAGDTAVLSSMTKGRAGSSAGQSCRRGSKGGPWKIDVVVGEPGRTQRHVWNRLHWFSSESSASTFALALSRVRPAGLALALSRVRPAGLALALSRVRPAGLACFIRHSSVVRTVPPASLRHLSLLLAHARTHALLTRHTSKRCF
jgi:hypothetical protein